jgi:hypothetical protein
MHVAGRTLIPLAEFPETDIRTCRGSANIEEELASEPTNWVMKLLTLDGPEIAIAGDLKHD